MRITNFSRHSMNGASESAAIASSEVKRPDLAESGSRRDGARCSRTSRWVVRLAAALILGVAMFAAPSVSYAEVAVGVSVSFGPPALPIYEQPFCPGPGYIWAPGYWAWDPDYGYFWVPGTWVMAPFEGALWTPGYWGYQEGLYVWYPGYWGPVVGFYGGINYGYGYTGYGYQGGYWEGRQFYYNRAVSNVHTTNITNVYNKTVVNNVSVTNVSYNGGPGGVQARATSEQMAAARERRSGAVQAQQRQMEAARRDPAQRARENKGRPQIAATMQPGEFNGHGAVRAERAGAPYKAPVGNAMQQQRKVKANPQSMPGYHPFEKPSRVNEPKRSVRPARRERAAPQRSMPSQPTYRREPPPQERAHPTMQSRPMQRQPMAHGQGAQRPARQARPPQGPGNGKKGHGPGNPHDNRR